MKVASTSVLGVTCGVVWLSERRRKRTKNASAVRPTAVDMRMVVRMTK